MTKENIVFSHGNGFPARVYSALHNELSDYDFSFIEAYGLGEYPITTGWTESINELIDFIETKHSEPVTALGHSFGGVISLLASTQRPELFKKVIAIDPPYFGIFKRYVIGGLRLINKEDKVFKQPRMALKRKHQFISRDHARDYFAGKPFFKNFHSKCFDDYIEYGFTTRNGQVELLIPPKLESDIFKLMPCFRRNEFIKPVESYFLYGNKKGVHDKKDILWLKAVLRNTRFVEYDGSHMLPLENPKACAELIRNCL